MTEKEKLNFISIIICFLIFIFSIFSFSYNINIKLENYNFNIQNKNILLLNKIVIVGDSRMELINRKKESLDIPNNIVFIAKSGAKIGWLYDGATIQLKETINQTNKYRYHVVFNLGVNDLDEEIDVIKRAKEYYNYYKIIIEKNKDISFYFLSVNPVDENRIYKYFSYKNKRTNKKIQKFNNYFINRLKKETLNNINYCDSYNFLDFYLPDGLHYDTETDKKIVKYIIEKCINY